jgi:hypothetical protein
MKKLLAVLLLVSACRTEIKPYVKPEPVARKQRYVEGECNVRDYPAATDIPSGSTALGWVKVDRAENDDATFEKLRKAVCAKGGDAMSQMHWNRASGASVADAPVELEANAWATP